MDLMPPRRGTTGRVKYLIGLARRADDAESDGLESPRKVTFSVPTLVDCVRELSGRLGPRKEVAK